MNSGDTIGESNTSHSGSGLNDAYFTGHFEGTSTTTYYVRIDGVGTGTGGVDTFEWSKDNFSSTEATGVDITGDDQPLDSNISIFFNATTGHTDNDTWSGTAAPLNVDTGWASNRNTGTSGVGYTHLGVMWDTASSQMIMFDTYDPEIEGNIDTAHASFSYAPLQIDGLTATTGSFSSNGSFGGTLTVTGATTLNSNVDINGNLDVSGNITSSSGAISFGNENLSTTGTLASGALTVTGNTTISGDLQVNGGDITSSTGAISFGNENLSTTGTLSAGAITGSSLNLSTGAVTAGSLDISGNVDVDGTMEADSYTVNGTALNEYIADTVGAMVSSNSESGISVTYQDADNTLDFDVGDFDITLTGDVTGSGTVTNLGNVSFATTIAANSVALGTDTTGNYVATVAAGGGISVSGSGSETAAVTVSHADTSSQASVNNSGNTYIQDITLDTYGHITGISSATVTPPTRDSLGIDTNDDVQFDSLGVGTAASGTTGEIRATNQITAYYSDARLKEFQGNIDNALDKVMALNGYYFVTNDRAKALGYTDDKRQVGVSAQEVQAVMPEIVTDAAINTNITDGTENDYLTVHYDRMVPLLIEAIKEQQKQIDELKAKLGE
jgi:cytoskeletal protein CcmA (bactofilin family)